MKGENSAVNMNYTCYVSFINRLINTCINVILQTWSSWCSWGHWEQYSVYSVLVFLPWLRFDKKAWVNNSKNRQAALEPEAYQSFLHENRSVPTGRATGQKILSEIWDVFAEHTDRGEIVLFLLFHLYPDKTVKGQAGGGGWTAF